MVISKLQVIIMIFMALTGGVMAIGAWSESKRYYRTSGFMRWLLLPLAAILCLLGWAYIFDSPNNSW